MSPPKKQLFDENGEELPTLSQILASETPQPLLQGFVSETPWPPKRPLGFNDDGASPKLKSIDGDGEFQLMNLELISINSNKLPSLSA